MDRAVAAACALGIRDSEAAARALCSHAEAALLNANQASLDAAEMCDIVSRDLSLQSGTSCADAKTKVAAELANQAKQHARALATQAKQHAQVLANQAAAHALVLASQGSVDA